MANIEGLSSTKKMKFESESDDEDNNLTYEQLREKRMKDNMEMFDVFGVTEAAKVLTDSLNKISQVKKSYDISNSIKKTLKPTRRSRRLANIPASEILIENDHDKKYNLRSNRFAYSFMDYEDKPKPNIKKKKSITIPKKDVKFFEKLNADLVIKESVNDFHMCDFDRFSNVLKSLKLNQPLVKVMKTRIYSVAIHPSETSLIIAVGGMNGNISIYNKNDTETREYEIHEGAVNCISFCTWDPYKLFSTSHDGSVRCGDIVKRTFDTIYSTKLWAKKTTKKIHSTWHTECERNILIGNGSGRVDLIDSRTPNKINSTAWCHQRSVRTVQSHPMEKQYFLTSSGIGEVSLWDVRNMTNDTINPVLQFEHFKSMTSAFFSDSGTKMVSTSSDDYIRIFDTSVLTTKATKSIKDIPHYNNTGQFLSVFKAKWNPGRDDAFFVGSMFKPRRINIFSSNGNEVHNLMSENMTTCCPVIEVHPTQAIYVGGNSSGSLHIFSTQQQFS